MLKVQVLVLDCLLSLLRNSGLMEWTNYFNQISMPTDCFFESVYHEVCVFIAESGRIFGCMMDLALPNGNCIGLIQLC